MKSFMITLGNTAGRGGHRKDCAQIRAEIRVSARSKEEALSLVQKRWKAKRKSVECMAADGDNGMFSVNDDASYGVTVFFRTDTLTLRDVREV
jgi:hypothetical protein